MEPAAEAQFPPSIRDSVLSFRRSLFADDSPDLFRYTFQFERGPGYCWALQEDRLILRIPDPDGLIPATRDGLYEITIDPVDEGYRGAVAELENEFQPLSYRPEAERMGRSQYGLVELPTHERFVLFDLLELEAFEPSAYRDRLLAFIEAVDGYEFSAAHALVRVLVSPISRMPVPFLHTHLTGESDTIIAFLRAFLPADNLFQFIDDLPPDRRAKIRTLSDEIAERDEFQAGVFRETERILERKFAATRSPES